MYMRVYIKQSVGAIYSAYIFSAYRYWIPKEPINNFTPFITSVPRLEAFRVSEVFNRPCDEGINLRFARERERERENAIGGERGRK